MPFTHIYTKSIYPKEQFVSVRSHPWIACRKRAQRPSVLCHDLFNGVIKWVKTQENIALTQETGPSVQKAREVLIQLLSVN